MRRVRSSSELAIVDSWGDNPSIGEVSPVGEVVQSHYRFDVLARLDVRGARDLRAALPAPPAGQRSSEIVGAVREILSAVRERGDAAVRELTEWFDGARVDELAVPDEERKRALD